jgi:hypothetical protein
MRKTSTGLLALTAIGAFYLYKNRFAVTEYLESIGINVPWLKGDASEAVRSGVAKLSGKAERGINEIERGEAV